MATPESTESTPLALLGNSLNYQPAVLESLMSKKQKGQKVYELHDNLNSLLKPLKDAEYESNLDTISTALGAFKGGTTKLKELLKNVDGAIKVELSSGIEKTLSSLGKTVDGVIANIDEAKKADEDSKSTATDKATESLQRVLKDKQPLEIQTNQVKELLSSDTTILLDESEQAADFFLASISTALFNDILPSGEQEGTELAAIRQKVRALSSEIDERVNRDLNAILHDASFKTLESNWLGLRGLIESTDWSANVMIDLLDCTKEELREDLENNAVDLVNSDLFKKVYVAEYDQYGGNPYGAIIGLYEFDNTEADRRWLRTIGKISAASHAPFISSVGPQFFGCKNIEELADIKDLAAHMSQPRFEKWQQLRESEEAAYIGLTVPRFLLRAPYNPESNPGGTGLGFVEKINAGEGYRDFLWCNASYLFAKNMINSFTHSGWCQYLRGPKGGGLVEHLPRYAFNINGQTELKAPVEIVIPDYRELQFSDAGFIPLIYRKNTADACFFSSQSIKKSKRFKDPHDTENSQLVTNLSYTFSITRIAHYVKCIMRDNIGSAADNTYINNVLQTWLSRYVTTVVNPDDLTLRHYPFKAATVVTTPQEGMIGWYNSEITVLPHIQFEGLDVVLKMDVRI
jgi:type VI secretion system protein ImpC